MIIGMGKRVKINLLEPNFQPNGVIYYSGYINGSYTHFLSYDKMSKVDIKRKLLEKYTSEGHII